MNQLFSFPITCYGLEEKISPTLTKKRVRIFYKGENRNGGYISDDFAEKLIKTLPYAPVKGIYEEDDEDYTDHGDKRDLGRIYGVVPEQYNFAWEKHLDEDNVEREYACCDVYLYSALYKEANEISGKGQSMELYGPSIKGDWVKINNKMLYKYTDAAFLGLQVLGDNTTPCFQGASFYSLDENTIYSILPILFSKIENISKGDSKMEKTLSYTFELSDNQKRDSIFKLLNQEKTRYFILDTYSDNVIIFDVETEKYFKVNFSEENDTITLDENMVEVYSAFITAEERDSLKNIKENIGGENFIEINENMTKALNDKDIEISTLKQNEVKLNENIEQLSSTITNLEQEKENLNSFKLKIEKEQKESVISKYRQLNKIGEDIIANYELKIDEYSVEDLDKDLAYELVKTDSSLFSMNPSSKRTPIDQNFSGIESLLSKYNKK